jgi:nucleoside-diphosphate-sugar epimerase
MPVIAAYGFGLLTKVDIYEKQVRISAEMARYCVTGAAGFVGSHLVGALLGAGHTVVGIDSFTDYYDRASKERNIASVAGQGFRLFELDLNDGATGRVLSDCDGIFHLAAQPGVRGSWGDTFSIYAADNVVATQRVFEAAANSGIRVVWASSSSVYGNAESYPTPETTRGRPVSPYGVSKLCCEHLADAYLESRGLDHVALRYFTVYGPRQRPDMAYARIVECFERGGRFTVYGSGDQSRDVTFVADAVHATVRAMERGARGAVYNVGGGSEISLNEAIATCERLTRRQLDVEHTADAVGDVRRTAADTSLARADLGWAPQVSVEEGLRRHLAWAGALPAE